MTRAWDILTTMRYDLWNHEMQKFIKPGMSQADVLDIGKNLADWANHATGSAKLPPGEFGTILREGLFGPASPLTRCVKPRFFNSNPTRRTACSGSDSRNAATISTLFPLAVAITVSSDPSSWAK
jgi:hypothetical protein